MSTDQDDDLMDRKQVSNRVSGRMEKAVALAGVGFCLVAASIFFYTLTVAPEPYAPLGPYPDQNVTSDLRVDGLPAFRPHELVNVDGRKCTDEDVEVFGTQVWQSIDPVGRALRTGHGTRFAQEGCTDVHYANEIPQAVAVRVKAQHAAGNPYPVWKITGIETPVNAETGENGESLTWETEPFVLVAEVGANP